MDDFNYIMMIYVLGYILLLLIFHEILRRFQWTSLIFIFILPIGLTAHWFTSDHFFYIWVKLYSVIFGVWWLYICRYTFLSNKKWALNCINLILIINIAEVILLDCAHQHWSNGIAGILLILSLIIIGTKTMRIEANKNRNLIWEIPLEWIIGYTLWNLTFVYNNYISYLWIQVAVLSSALLIAFYNKQLWIQARAIILFLYLLQFYTFWSTFKPLRSSINFNQETSTILSSISIVWLLIVTSQLLYKKHIGTSQKYCG